MAMRGLASAAVMCFLEGKPGRLYMMRPTVAQFWGGKEDLNESALHFGSVEILRASSSDALRMTAFLETAAQR